MAEEAKRRRTMSDAELIELIRYAVLMRGEFDLSDEFSAAIFSTWFLMNPLKFDGRDKVGKNTQCKSLIQADTDSRVKFTAHSHPDEPQTPSPDDALIYSSINSGDTETVNFITDRFNCNKIL